MKFDLKSVALSSTVLALALNGAQLVSRTNHPSKSYFTPSWALASAATPAPSPASSLPILTKMPPVATSNSALTNQPLPAVPSAVASIATTLAANGFDSSYASLYLQVQARTRTPWQLLASVHKIETGQSGNTDRTSYAGAEGPMQFMPSTFAHYATDGNGDSRTDITNVADALMTAGTMLAANGASSGNYQSALFAYNHSEAYVAQVTTLMNGLGL